MTWGDLLAHPSLAADPSEDGPHMIAIHSRMGSSSGIVLGDSVQFALSLNKKGIHEKSIS